MARVSASVTFALIAIYDEHDPGLSGDQVAAYRKLARGEKAESVSHASVRQVQC
jgi:hypothetical protein